MKRFITLLSFTALLFIAISSPLNVTAQDRYAECDACGYCPNASETPPGNWPKCQRCVYPEAYPTEFPADATEKRTLLVNEETNLPPTPALGTHFTVFGCIKTDIGDFTQEGAASSLVQVLLNVIFTAAGGVAILYIIYGSIAILTSQGNTEKLAYGKRLIMGAVIGLVLVLLSVFIVNLIANRILRLPGFSE